ncbi:MAG TPA: hypothetical protein VH186_03550 [Chloroflexia bacterium]|nr:hypothetical protein [Chloroflexia bacterium]
MAEIEIFVQGEGLPAITRLKIDDQRTVRELIEVAKSSGLATGDDLDSLIVLLEDSEAALLLNQVLKDAGIGNRSRVHIHSRHKIEVTINYDKDQAVESFPPSTTVGKVKKWADHKFDLKGVDATDHILQICGTSTRPDEETHIGVLVHAPDYKLCFNLVPKSRVEG